jgi:hypothetical protein
LKAYPKVVGKIENIHPFKPVVSNNNIFAFVIIIHVKKIFIQLPAAYGKGSLDYVKKYIMPQEGYDKQYEY